MSRRQTPSQTVGPYFAYGLTPGQYGYRFSSIVDGTIAGPEEEGQQITLEGQVFDGNGSPVSDAMIEVWQADAQGRYAHPADTRGSNTGFKGFGRFGTGTDPQNRFLFETVKPGSAAEGTAPHLNVIVFMRGLLVHLFTRVYFDDESAANAADPVLSAVDAARRDTLIARRQETPRGIVYRWDIHMQGERETVFFDV